MPERRIPIFVICTALLAITLGGCNWHWQSSGQQKTAEERRKERDEKIREEARKATERAKPELKAAGRELGKAARSAAEDAAAAAQGVWDGWTENHRTAVNINHASEKELSALPGISREDAQKIIQARPYRSKEELVRKGVLSEAHYNRVRDELTV